MEGWKQKEFQPFSSKSGRGCLGEVVAYKRLLQYSYFSYNKNGEIESCNNKNTEVFVAFSVLLMHLPGKCLNVTLDRRQVQIHGFIKWQTIAVKEATKAKKFEEVVELRGRYLN